MAKAADIERLRYLIDKPDNKPIRLLLEQLTDEINNLKKEVAEMIPPGEHAYFEKQADERANLIIEIFSFLREVEAGHYDRHVYTSEKAFLRRWAKAADVDVD